MPRWLRHYRACLVIRLALALRPAPVVAEVKALAVAVAGIAGSFASGWLKLPPNRGGIDYKESHAREAEEVRR